MPRWSAERRAVPLGRCRARSTVRWQHLIVWRGSKTLRLPALRLPSFFFGRVLAVPCHSSDAKEHRENDDALSPPPQSGGGGPPVARASERRVVEGARASTLCLRG